MRYFAGVEGGSTGSSVVLMDDTGRTLASLKGPALNPLLIGEEECLRRIDESIRELKSRSGSIAEDQQVSSLGLCLSGCVTDDDCHRLARNMMRAWPQAAANCVAACDTIGSLMTSNCKAGIVLISGTGSNSLLFDSHGIKATCGGWGHLFGDEGSAYWIAWKAYKTILDDNDNFNAAPYETKRLREVLCDHFKIDDEQQVGHFYRQPNKRKFASLSRELYSSTKSRPDEAIDDIFRQAGCMLAKKVAALLPKASPETLETGLNIICVGSVFNSWDLLEPGFVRFLSGRLQTFRLLKLKCSSACGAAKLAAKQLNHDLPLHDTTELLYAYSATIDGYLANGQHVNTRHSNGKWNGAHSHQVNGNPHNANGSSNGRDSRQWPGDSSEGQLSCSIL